MKLRVFKGLKKRNSQETDFLLTEVTYNEHTKQIVNFVVLQHYVPVEEKLEVIKHDFSHGIYHVHCYFKYHAHKDLFPDESLTPELVIQCKNDILLNWRKYRDAFVRKYF